MFQLWFPSWNKGTEVNSKNLPDHNSWMTTNLHNREYSSSYTTFSSWLGNNLFCRTENKVTTLYIRLRRLGVDLTPMSYLSQSAMCCGWFKPPNWRAIPENSTVFHLSIKCDASNMQKLTSDVLCFDWRNMFLLCSFSNKYLVQHMAVSNRVENLPPPTSPPTLLCEFAKKCCCSRALIQILVEDANHPSVCNISQKESDHSKDQLFACWTTLLVSIYSEDMVIKVGSW